MSKKGGNYPKLLRALDAWFARRARVLPWRDEPSLYRVWVSEIMLQQTQVATVIPYFERFLTRFPSVESLAAASEDEVMLHWAGLGYYSRARNLRRGAQAIVQAGEFPRTREGWLGVPGVGEYTAGAILSIALDRPEAILDGNVERVLSRFWRVDRADGDSAYKKSLWELSRRWVEESSRLGLRPSRVNQALMELGATVCTPKNARCVACPLAAGCGAHRCGTVESYPPKKRPREWLEIRETKHACWSGSELLLERSEGAWRRGLWDLADSKPGPGWVSLGRFESRYVVTRHRVTRITEVWRPRVPKARLRLRAAERSDRVWVSFPSEAPDSRVAVGAALRKSWNSIAALLPEDARAPSSPGSASSS